MSAAFSLVLNTAYVMNHHGLIVNAEFLQHGGRANISIMTVGKMLIREFDDTDKALEKIVDAGWFGGVGLVSPGMPSAAPSACGASAPEMHARLRYAKLRRNAV